ncbi:aldehyde dehydrogenase family protein [Nocardia africana]|uniref:Aldehyde dehydrogenase family protein n=1 Tax=Nocardia africana TaxID=134964 RepID=A0ABW6NCF5_9NOCA
MKILQNLVGGRWEPAQHTELLDLVNPATEQAIAQFPAGSVADVDRAVGAAAEAQRSWAQLPVAERVDRLQAWATAIIDHAPELAELECSEMGKPVELARTFVVGAVEGFRVAVNEALTYPFTEQFEAPDGSSTTIIRNPLGVAAVITPWNFSVPMLLTAVGPLLAAGNTVVVKPSERSPLAAGRLFELADLPPGVVNLVHGDSRSGEPLVQHPGVNLVHFAGSVESGRKVGASAGGRLVRSVLELGGKDPVIVDADVDPVTVAQAVAVGAFLNTGQICTSMERIYVHEDVADAFIEALIDAAGTFALGDGHDEATVLGPLVDDRQRQIVHRHVNDAVAKGAKVKIGGEIPDRTGYFYPPTVLTDVDESMLIMTEETFGPVAPIAVVSSFDEAVKLACRTRFGLAATVYTSNPDHIAAATRIPTGVTWINLWQGGSPDGVFEPAGDSGMGASGARASYDAATRPSSVFAAA